MVSTGRLCFVMVEPHHNSCYIVCTTTGKCGSRQLPSRCLRFFFCLGKWNGILIHNAEKQGDLVWETKNSNKTRGHCMLQWQRRLFAYTKVLFNLHQKRALSLNHMWNTGLAQVRSGLPHLVPHPIVHH